jgi:hypothetical protein
MFAVEDIDDVVTRLRAHSAELVGGAGAISYIDEAVSETS